MAQTYDLTTGKVSKIILNFFFPIFMSGMLQQIYTVADIAVVGKGLGDAALAAVGNMSSLTFFIFGFSMGLANGFSVSMAQSFGAKDYGKLRRAIASSIKLSVWIGIFLTAFSIVFLKKVLILMQTDPKILDDSLTYGYIIFGGLVVTLAYNLCGTTLRALGDSRTSFIAIVVSSVVNIVLNCVSIFVLKTGVGGPAVATIISQVISVWICWAKLSRIDVIRLSAEDFRTDVRLCMELFGNGLPMALMNSVTALGCMVVQYFVNGMGVAATSAYSTCSKYINLLMQPACSAGFAMASFTSQNYGAGKYSRISEGLRVCLRIAVLTYVVFGSVMVFFPETLARTMLSGDDSVALAKEFLPRCGVAMITLDLMFVFRNACQGMGKQAMPMISGFAEMIVRIALIMLLTDKYGFAATAYAESSAWASALLINGAAYFYHMSRAKRLESKKALQ